MKSIKGQCENCGVFYQKENPEINADGDIMHSCGALSSNFDETHTVDALNKSEGIDPVYVAF